jgi:hypothetical protein
MKLDIPRSPLALARWIVNARPAPRKGTRRIAGIMATKNYRDECSAFRALSGLCDVAIVLDDNSAAPFPYRGDCTDYIAIANEERWNAPANLTLLMYRAFVLGCEWVVSLDDDVIPGSGFQAQSDVLEVVETMAARKYDICHFKLRDLWNSDHEVRVDGIWSDKTFPVVRRNWFFYPGVTLRDPALRLHTAAFPADLRIRHFIHPNHRIYHTGCMTPERRLARVEKYRVEDPDHTFQQDYSYMLDDESLVLEAVPKADIEVIRSSGLVMDAG